MAPEMNEKLQFLIDRLGRQPDLIDRLREVQAAAEKEWKSPELSWFTDHGVGHSERLIALIYDIILPLSAGPDQAQALNEGELFVLLASCYFHDLGMQYLQVGGHTRDTLTTRQYKIVRKRHAEWSAQKINEKYADIIGPYLDPVHDIVLAHGGHHFQAMIERKDLKDYSIPPFTIRGGFLAALLLMADELDLQYARIDKNIKKLKLGQTTYPPESLFHIYKHYYIREVVIKDSPTNPRERDIKILFRFPQDAEEYADKIIDLVHFKLRAQCRTTQAALWSGGLRWGKIETEKGTPLPAGHIFPPEAIPFLEQAVAESLLIDREPLLEQVKVYLDDLPPDNEVLLVWGEQDCDSVYLKDWLLAAGRCDLDLCLRHLIFLDDKAMNQEKVAIETAPLLDPGKPGLLIVSLLHQAANEVREWLWQEHLPMVVGGTYKNWAIIFLDEAPKAFESNSPMAKIYELSSFAVDDVSQHLIDKLGYDASAALSTTAALMPQSQPAGTIIKKIEMQRRLTRYGKLGTF
jgi:hypothetical protein